MLHMLKKLIQQSEALDAPAVARDTKAERDWPPPYNC